MQVRARSLSLRGKNAAARRQRGVAGSRGYLRLARGFQIRTLRIWSPDAPTYRLRSVRLPFTSILLYTQHSRFEIHTITVRGEATL